MSKTSIDLRSRYGISKGSELVIGIESINNSIENILTTAIGERLFRPNFGSRLHTFLHEPINEITASDIEDDILLSLEQYEKRIKVDQKRLTVTPNYEEQAYIIKVPYIILSTKTYGEFLRIVERGE